MNYSKKTNWNPLVLIALGGIMAGWEVANGKVLESLLGVLTVLIGFMLLYIMNTVEESAKKDGE